MINPFQRTCARHYAGGDFAHVQSLDQAREQHDTLFTFLMVELSSTEGCDRRDEAVRRIEMAIDTLRDVLDALQDMDEGAVADGGAALSVATVTLRFRPQALIRDHAVPVDIEHPDRWMVPRSHFLDRFPTQDDWHEKHEERDAMRAESGAPGWIRDWSGPFEVEIADDDDPWASLAPSSEGEGA